MPWAALAGALGSALSMFGQKKSAEDSSALQYYYQTKLNQQNFGYNTKLINMQNAFNEAMMDKANAYNTDMWNKSVDLSNTAHQRQVSDLRAAGLNPILSANGGASVVNPIQSAQTSSGNSQLSSSAGMPDIDYLQGLNTAASMYQENRRVKNELENSKTQREFVGKQGLKVLSDMEVNKSNSASQIAKNNAEIRQINANIRNNNKLTNAQVQKLASDATLNFENSARSRQETKNLANEYEHYTVQNGIQLGKFGTFGRITHPNQKPTYTKGGSYTTNNTKGVHYEKINGKVVPVNYY